jgi:hypothetical protein
MDAGKSPRQLHLDRIEVIRSADFREHSVSIHGRETTRGPFRGLFHVQKLARPAGVGRPIAIPILAGPRRSMVSRVMRAKQRV